VNLAKVELRRDVVVGWGWESKKWELVVGVK